MIKQKFLAFILMYSVGLLFLPLFAGSLHAAGDEGGQDLEDGGRLGQGQHGGTVSCLLRR